MNIYFSKNTILCGIISSAPVAHTAIYPATVCEGKEGNFFVAVVFKQDKNLHFSLSHVSINRCAGK